MSNVDIGNTYDTWFNLAVTNPQCGIKKYWLGGCDAGGYASTFYDNSNNNRATMTQQNVIYSNSG